MSTLSPHQQVRKATQLASTNEHRRITTMDYLDVWVADFEHPEKEVKLSSAAFGKPPTSKEPHNALRITTLSQPDLHERYNSSEEEPSPSPDSDSGSQYDEDEVEDEDEDIVEHGNTQSFARSVDQDKENEDPDGTLLDDTKAQTAVAVPIMAIGRPKLVDITNLAPMHKRKRSSDYPLPSRTNSRNTICHIPSGLRETMSSNAASATGLLEDEDTPPRRESSATPQPTSWLPEDVNVIHEQKEEEDAEEAYFDLKLQNTPSYTDYDPYSLNPPKLSPRNSLSAPTKKPGSVARARKQVNKPMMFDKAPGLRGFGRSLSLAKRQESQSPPNQLKKKPRMLARGPTERTEVPYLPACSAEGRRGF